MGRQQSGLILLAAGLAAAAAGAALAGVAGRDSDSDATIHACRRPSGSIRVVTDPALCRRNERPLTWNVQGPKGEPGEPGPQGPMGPQGPQGEPGPGLESFEALSGLRCTLTGESGEISIAYDAEGRAVITCTTGGGGGGGEAALRVNELSTGTTGAAADEFVEIVNAGEAPAAVGGYKLVYRSASGTSDVVLATIPAGTTIAAGGFYLFGGSAYAGSAAADQSFSFGLAAAGGGVGLRDAEGNLVDSVGYGSATNALVETAPAPAPPTTDPPGASVARMPDGRDTNDNSADLSVDSTPTPGSANS